VGDEFSLVQTDMAASEIEQQDQSLILAVPLLALCYDDKFYTIIQIPTENMIADALTKPKAL